ncbi:MAG: hypothetical protein M1823_006716 [Watsoniomyces obsoletus]|nr:MAG: hypothetical protein M1823_006716 [Watsoniomyces obsoletus]
MNSNEPVLLINTFGTLRHEQIRDIIRTTLQQLQQNWSIWPVRAYAGPFVVGEVDEAYQHHGFSVTLLNVVNTDIGGPSMIDLLDQGCDAPIWSWSLDSFFKETWRDRQLVDRYETGAPLSRSSSSDSISRHSGESQVSDAVEAPVPGPSVEPVSDRVSLEVDDSEVHSLNINVLADVGIDRQEVETEESIKKTPGISDTPKDDESIWDDVRAQYDNQNVGKAIKHPTFEHASGGGSLLDLIRSQAGDADDAGNEAEHEASTGDPSSAERQTACPGDDEFVVV